MGTHQECMENSISRNNSVSLFFTFCPQDHRKMQTLQTIALWHKRKGLECISCHYFSSIFPADTSTTWMGSNHPPRTGQGKGAWSGGKSQEFKKTFEYPQAYRTSNALDRLMDYQDRLLYSMRYFHRNSDSAVLYLRAMALLWNFHPYCTRISHKDSVDRASPFRVLNGFHYHKNWLHNMLVAASMGGWKS